jgi:hypothetical protein
MSDQSRRIADLMAAAEKSVKATERALLALESLVGQTKGILADLRKAQEASAREPGRPRRKRAKAAP